MIIICYQLCSFFIKPIFVESKKYAKSIFGNEKYRLEEIIWFDWKQTWTRSLSCLLVAIIISFKYLSFFSIILQYLIYNIFRFSESSTLKTTKLAFIHLHALKSSSHQSKAERRLIVWLFTIYLEREYQIYQRSYVPEIRH